MKKILFLLFCTLAVTLHADTLSPEDKQVRDSIFRIYQSMPADTAGVQFLKEAFVRHIDKDWATELLDSALTLALAMGDRKSEMKLRYEYFHYYTFRVDGANMEKTFLLLKDAAYSCNLYDDYFLGLFYMLQLKGSEGDTEYAIVKSRQMREEATRLNVPKGVFLSYVAEGKAYGFAKNFEKSVEFYKKALEQTPLSTKDELLVHKYLTNTYYLLERTEDVLSELKRQREIIDGIIGNDSVKLGSYRDDLLAIELDYCKLYLALPKPKELKKHLDEAAKFYSDDCFRTAFINYHFSWAGYYYLMEDWEKCFPQFERALSGFGGTQPAYEVDMRRMMGDVYMEAKRYKEAAETYEAAALLSDSVNKATLRMNEETIQSNYRIRKFLLDKEIGRKRFWQVAVGGSFVFFLLLVFGVLRLQRIRRALKLSEGEMRESYAVVKATDKMKEVFLHNITNEIRVPLNSVVTLSDYLCRKTNLTVEQQQEYSDIIKRDAGKLIDLIFNILDLSRLESGMTKFNVQEVDVVQLCKDAQLMVEMRDGNPIQLDFHTDLDALNIQADSARFLKLLDSVLSAPKDYNEPHRVDFVLSREGDWVKVTVKNSLLLLPFGSERGREIQHNINRLYLETFGGSYYLPQEGEESVIIIKYPVK